MQVGFPAGTPSGTAADVIAPIFVPGFTPDAAGPGGRTDQPGVGVGFSLRADDVMNGS